MKTEPTNAPATHVPSARELFHSEPLYRTTRLPMATRRHFRAGRALPDATHRRVVKDYGQGGFTTVDCHPDICPDGSCQ